MFLIIIRMNAASSVMRTRAIGITPRREALRRDLLRLQGNDLHGVLAIDEDETGLRERKPVDEDIDSIGRSAVELDHRSGRQVRDAAHGAAGGGGAGGQ